MPTVYRTPGVYKEEVFLQPQARLPTGIPGFIGFAHAIAPLQQLLQAFPDSYQDKIRYDRDKKLLVCSGVMTADIKDELLNFLPEDLVYQKAIQSLFERSQQLIPLYHQQDFDNQLQSPSNSYLAEAVNGFFENGGIRCYVVRAIGEPKKEALIQALAALEPLNDLDLVAIPDAMTLLPDQQAIIDVQREVLQHCAKSGDRIAILDSLPSLLTDGQPKLTLKKDIQDQYNCLVENQKEPINGVIYFPWLKNTWDYPKYDNLGQLEKVEKGRFVPPCGHITGVIARSDGARGVFKAPANEEIFDALDLEVLVDNSLQDEFNPKGINCLRAFPGRGIRVWGARTLSRDVNWRYVNVRRLFLTLARWIDQNMFWATFEPNSLMLWVRIQRELSFYLETLWQAGALKGQTRDEAFYVKCDEETNPSESVELGNVITEIGLAPNSPAEFIIVRIIHNVSAVEITQPYL
jgi:uncharacterized protein